MELRAIANARRAKSDFGTADAGSVDGEREKDVGVADIVVIEEILGARLESVCVQRPATEGNG